MTDTLSFQEAASKLIERIATDLEMFFLLSSFVLATDAFLYSFDKQHRTLISFDWSFAHGFDIGAILIFFVIFSFVMTIAAPLLGVASRFLLVVGWKASLFLVPCAAVVAWLYRALPLVGWLVFSMGFLPVLGEVIVLLQSQDRDDQWPRRGYVLPFDITRFALSHKDNYYLKAYVDEVRRARAVADGHSFRLGILGFPY